MKQKYNKNTLRTNKSILTNSYVGQLNGNDKR